MPQPGDVVVWPDRNNPTKLLVGKVERLGITVAGQMHMDVLPMLPVDDVGPKLYAPTEDKATPIMVRKLRTVDAQYIEENNAFRIEEDQLFLKRAKEFIDVAAERERIFAGYNELKEDLLEDAIAAVGFGTLCTSVYVDTDLAAPFATGGAAGLGYLYLLMQYSDNYAENKLKTNISRLRFTLPAVALSALAVQARVAEGVTGQQVVDLLSQDPWNILKVIAVPPTEFAAAMAGFLAHRLPLLGMSVAEIVATAYMEITTKREDVSFSQALRERYDPNRERKNKGQKKKAKRSVEVGE
jgi:hypothetical protein